MGKISVGPPYFGLMFAILMAPLMILMPLAPLTRWQKGEARILSPTVVVALSVLAAILAGLGWYVDAVMPWRAYMGVAAALWIAALTIKHFIEATARLRAAGHRSRWPGRGVMGMTMAHLGVAVFVVGVTFVESRGVEKDLAMSPGDSYEVEGYRFQFDGVDRVRGPNYLADQGHFVVFDGDREIARLDPQKRQYSDQSQIMTEAAIDAGLLRDLYVALGEPLGGDGSWAVRVYYKPFVRWIWLGALLMTVGGLWGATDKRYRQVARQRARSVPEPATTGNTPAAAAS